MEISHAPAARPLLTRLFERRLCGTARLRAIVRTRTACGLLATRAAVHPLDSFCACGGQSVGAGRSWSRRDWGRGFRFLQRRRVASRVGQRVLRHVSITRFVDAPVAESPSRGVLRITKQRLNYTKSAIHAVGEDLRRAGIPLRAIVWREQDPDRIAEIFDLAGEDAPQIIAGFLRLCAARRIDPGL